MQAGISFGKAATLKRTTKPLSSALTLNEYFFLATCNALSYLSDGFVGADSFAAATDCTISSDLYKKHELVDGMKTGLETPVPLVQFLWSE